MLRIGMASGWHVHARGYANELRDIPGAAIAAVWDEDPERGAKWAEELGVPFEPDMQRFMARDDMDGIVCDAPTNRHAEVMIAAADAGKHIFTEKVMALTVKECNAIAEAVRKAGVQFCISFPARTRPKFLFAKRVAEEGLIGDITLLRVRVAHDGASSGWLPPHFYDPVACGGGAMMDLGAHPMYLARWILGQPTTIRSTFLHTTGHEVEDNAVSMIEFQNKAIAIVETSFVSRYSPDILELHGTAGTLFTGGPEDSVVLKSDKLGGSMQGWIRPADLPPAMPRPVRIWADALMHGTPIPFGLDEGTQLTELMQNAYAARQSAVSFV